MNLTRMPANASLANSSRVESRLRNGGHREPSEVALALAAVLVFIAILALLLVLRVLRNASQQLKAEMQGKARGKESKESSKNAFRDACKALSCMEQGDFHASLGTVRPSLLEEILVVQEGRPVRRSRSSAVSPV